MWSQHLRDPARDDRVLFAVARVLQHLLAEVRVDCRVGASPRGCRERQRRDALPLPAQQQLGAGRDQRRIATAGTEHEARRELRPQHAEDRCGVIRARGVHLDLPREHDLAHAAGPDQLDCAGDGLLVVLGGHRAEDLVAARRGRVEQRQGLLAKLREPSQQPVQQLFGVVVRLHERAQRERDERHTASLAAREAHLRHHQARGGERPPVRRRAAIRREAETADGERTGRVGAVGGVRERAPGQLPPARRELRETVRTGRAQLERLAQGAQRPRTAIGLLEDEPGLARTA